MELCDGDVETIRPGWNGAVQTEAYDIFGLTYEYNFYNNRCGEDYDIYNNDEDLNYVDPCDQNIAQDVIDKCAEIKANNEECCDDVIGGNVCDELEEDCQFDACVVATDNGGTQQDITEAVEKLFNEAIGAVCAVPDVGNDVDPGNLLEADYLGCYKDNLLNDRARTFEWPENPVRRVTSMAECIDLCVAESMPYMGLQYGNECFCSAGNDDIMAEPRDPTENGGQCGMNERNTNKYNAYGCFGGAWTNCVYDISANLVTWMYII